MQVPKVAGVSRPPPTASPTRRHDNHLTHPDPGPNTLRVHQPHHLPTHPQTTSCLRSAISSSHQSIVSRDSLPAPSPRVIPTPPSRFPSNPENQLLAHPRGPHCGKARLAKPLAPTSRPPRGLPSSDSRHRHARAGFLAPRFIPVLCKGVLVSRLG